MLTEFEITALLCSLKIASIAILFSLPITIALAWVLARKQFIGKVFLETLVYAPLLLPPVSVGYLLLLVFGRTAPIGAWLYNGWGISFAFDWKGASLAAAIMAMPLMVGSFRIGFEGIDKKLEAAARTLGASPKRVFFAISIPLAFPSLLTGSLLGFARALGEFGATIAFVGNIAGETQTLPLALYTLYQSPYEETQATRLLFLSLAIAFGAILLSHAIRKVFLRGTK